MFDKKELDLLYTALLSYYLELNGEYEREKAKGRHKTGWQLKTMQKINALQSKIYNLKNSM